MSETANMEKHSFQTEVKQLLHIMVHSLYSNKEIFLRELISNAADAVDKLRFKSLDDSSLIADDPDFKIRITTDEKAGTVTISDNGIGMTKDDLISNLGTIARSGTAEFLTQLSGDQKKDANLIGQFGVGFYSGFIVADKMTVVSKAAGTDEAHQWVSSGEGEFEIAAAERATRGTDIILHLKQEEKEFLSEWRLRSIIGKYSDHISVPVEMLKPAEPAEEGKEPEPSTEFEAVNKATALWTRSKSDISDEDYKEFYKHISHDFAEPMTWAHNKVEGKQEYTSLLYIPKNAPYDLWNRERSRGVKLYVQRVFIMDDAEQFLPIYLRFVRGVLDSNDLPLNVSREILQDSSVTQSLKNACVKRVLSMLEKTAKNKPEDYQHFWQQFGSVMKEGLGEDFSNRETIAGLMRFASTHNDDQTQNVSLDDYIGRMTEGQDKIYYITAESFETAKNSPHLEVFRKKGIEVLLLSDRIDEWAISHLTDFKEKKLVSVTQGDLDLGNLEDEKEKQEREQVEKENQPLAERFKEVLAERVKEVKVTTRLTDSPACVVSSEGEMSAQMARLMASAGQEAPEVKPVFEFNPEHPLVKRAAEQSGDDFNDWTLFLFDQAMLAESGSLKDPGTFTRRLNALLLK
ncbi:molecular chaperone HtpG [Pleionea mediterranea]|jgi:molecular chaperone HtpG|uniref:Chaperone protein HtpG n=1 Tax=Pleionea mediterranea TaxID=523701 RepID=A0A316FQL5_9GAMM|nr:molecular chaperone HtpG [Pleionea mediterranea]PWK50964.1 molecular chaperone HtpG [Pleionea mediterranea]